MLARLRHQSFVRRYDKQGAVDPRRPGDHGVDEPLVTRHVDERNLHFAVWIGQSGEAEHEGDAAPLFLYETVAIYPGERFHERRFAVIDVTGRPENRCAHTPILAAREG